MHSIFNIYIDVCSKALSFQDYNSGHMPSGHNGPYYDMETPIRNTSHWIISFIKAYNCTNENKYLIAAEKATNYLVNNKVYRTGFTFIQRMNKRKDLVNGVIGPAWNIEALVKAYSTFGNANIISLAEHLQEIHKFNDKYGLWGRCFNDGTSGPIDYTFNHQLWFAAATSELYQITHASYLKKQLDCFFDNLHFNFRSNKSGLIKHNILKRSGFKDHIKNHIRPVKDYYSKISRGQSVAYKEKGYQHFNMYAFSKIYYSGYEHDFFLSDKFKNVLNYSFHHELLADLLVNHDKKDITNLRIVKNLKGNRYSYPYNAPGFELPYIDKVFKTGHQKIVEDVLNNQIELTYNSKDKVFSKNTDDENTLTSRIYELSEII